MLTTGQIVLMNSAIFFGQYLIIAAALIEGATLFALVVCVLLAVKA